MLFVFVELMAVTEEYCFFLMNFDFSGFFFMNHVKMMKNTRTQGKKPIFWVFFATWTHTNGKPIVLTDGIYLANGAKREGLKRTFY